MQIEYSLKGFCFSRPNSNLSENATSPWGKTLLHEKALYLGKMALSSHKRTQQETQPFERNPEEGVFAPKHLN